MEQLVNLYVDTLAAPYVAGSGVMVVTTGNAGLTTGTFSLTILNSSGTVILLIFRVASVTAVVTFNGASEGPDANAPMGSIVIGTMLTAAAIAQIKIDAGGGGAGFIQPLTAPIAAEFTALNYNVGTGVVTTQVNNSSPVTSISMKQTDPSNTENIAALAKAIVNVLFTVTECVQFTPAGNLNQAFCGLWLSDGGSPPHSILFGIQSTVGVRVSKFSDFTSYAGDLVSPIDSFPTGLLWLRIQETALLRIYSLSTDGITFAVIHSEPVATYISTAEYGIAVECRGGGPDAPDTMLTLYSFAESTP